MLVMAIAVEPLWSARQNQLVDRMVCRRRLGGRWKVTVDVVTWRGGGAVQTAVADVGRLVARSVVVVGG